MAASNEVKLFFEQAMQRALKDIQVAGQVGFREGAELAVRLIREQTRQGMDRTGKAFTPYADTTARRKGRKVPVTLTERATGSMLEDMYVDMGAPVDGLSTARILFRPRGERLARFHIHGSRRNLPARPFFGLSRQADMRLRQEVMMFFQRVQPKGDYREIELHVFGP